jgi:hypothetical protein
MKMGSIFLDTPTISAGLASANLIFWIERYLIGLASFTSPVKLCRRADAQYSHSPESVISSESLVPASLLSARCVLLLAKCFFSSSRLKKSTLCSEQYRRTTSLFAGLTELLTDNSTLLLAQLGGNWDILASRRRSHACALGCRRVCKRPNFRISSLENSF